MENHVQFDKDLYCETLSYLLSLQRGYPVTYVLTPKEPAEELKHKDT